MGAAAMFKDFLNALVNKFRFNKQQGQKKILGRKLEDDFYITVEGIPTLELERNGVVIARSTSHNIVTQRASVLVQKLLMMQADTYGITHIALGIGDPHGLIPDNLNDGQPWLCNRPPAAPPQGGRIDPTTGRPILVNEIARKKIDSRHYLNEDYSISQTILQTGEAVSLPTHIGEYKALFLEHEGNGPIMEFGLVGGDVFPNDVDYIPSYQTDERGVLLEDVNGHFIPIDDPASVRLINPGDLTTYKTHKLFYKTSEDRLRVSYILKMSLNNADPEPAAD
jgi:hypothetical protein